jgi:long-chain acyl-CoA synthetase
MMQPVLSASTAGTVVSAFRRTVTAYPARVAFRSFEGDRSLTWSELGMRVDRLAGGLAGLGLRRGDTLAIMASNRPEFHLIDLAALTAGVVPFSIYQTASPEQIEYVVSDSRARIAVIEARHLERFLMACGGRRSLEHVIVLDDGPAGTLPLSDVESYAGSFDAQAAADMVAPDDLVTLIYTSGTTGPPKGVELTHRKVLLALAWIEELIPDDAHLISWLPAAHIAERAAHHYLPIVRGLSVTCCPDPRQLPACLREVHPRWLFGVPRIWEKLKAGLDEMIATTPQPQRGAIEDALSAAFEKLRAEQRGEQVAAQLAQQVARADQEIFAGLRQQAGLDRVVNAHVAGAPTPLDVLEFFHAVGVPLYEFYGMTETCAWATLNRRGHVKLGTVGLPAPNTEIKLAGDGEILVRSEAVMAGYHNQPGKTAEALDSHGWLHTGDIGTLDEDGYLTIIDRKKELIINSWGKNMSPASIEATLTSASPLIAHACVIGDRRPYNTALITLEPESASLWADRHGLAGKTLAELAREPALQAAIQDRANAANAKLARVEQIKRHTILPVGWAPEGDELTPTQKLRRKAIAAKYSTEIDAMYPVDDPLLLRRTIPSGSQAGRRDETGRLHRQPAGPAGPRGQRLRAMAQTSATRAAVPELPAVPVARPSPAARWRAGLPGHQHRAHPDTAVSQRQVRHRRERGPRHHLLEPVRPGDRAALPHHAADWRHTLRQ